ncbi:putative peptidase C1A, papain, patatin-like phospholipase domain-containing protein [Helianthus debilis subsp. tardiflorus]
MFIPDFPRFLKIEEGREGEMWHRIIIFVVMTAVTHGSSSLTREEWYPRFESWLVGHGKAYNIPGDKEQRFQIYYENAIYVENHNSQNHPYKLKLNRFADLSLVEYIRSYKSIDAIGQWRKRETESLIESNRYSPTHTDVLPEAIDWREKGVVAPVRDNGTCGSSWAFSTTESMEAINHNATGELVTMSGQLLECNTCYNKGCNTGDKHHDFPFIVECGGIDADNDYAYTGKDERCYSSTNKRRVVWIDGYEGIPVNDEQSLRKAVANQPIFVSIEAGSRDFQFYSSGIFTGKCGTDMDHSVVVVGYGNEGGKDYWLVRNTWGVAWGVQGYLKIERNVEEKTGKCGIAMKAFYPIMNSQSSSNQQFKEESQPPPEQHVVPNLTTIQSIDGGGERGTTPTDIIALLETKLQELGGDDFRLVDYIDLIAGTSTGGLVMPMLATPNKEGHPVFEAKDVTDFYPIKNGINPPIPAAGSHPNPLPVRRQLLMEYSHVSPKVITILSIDGGGVRALIPSAALVFLESRIQALLGKNVMLADVFDVITGTSTGALVTTMLTTPNEKGRPMFSAKEVQNFYLKHASKIFPSGRLWKALWGPIYNGKYLRKVIREQLQERRLNDTITNVVIPTYDIKDMQPVIFSNFQLKINPNIDAKLSDICIATSAAPIYLPSHEFDYKDSKGNKLREFNLIDGGVIANNPVSIAVAEVIKDKMRDSTWSPNDYRFLVLSLGTGCKDLKGKYNAKKTSLWNIIGWLYNGGSIPLVDFLSLGYSDMADYFSSAYLEALNTELYLRIQDFTLCADMASMDLATDENLKNLVKAGENLLKEPVTRKNLVTGKLEKANITNEMAIGSFAKKLRDIYRARSEMDKEVRNG